MLPHERAAAIAAQARANAEPERQRNRREMPELVAWAESLEATMPGSVRGKGSAGTLQENGRTVEWGVPVTYSYEVVASVGPKRKERKRDTRP